MRILTWKRGWWATGIGVSLVGVVICVFVFNLFHAHEHCIKQTGLSLRQYAADHFGKFPFHTNGFGDAILLMAKEDPYNIRLFTAPGDDGRRLKECLRTGAHMPEARCTRAYVQGFSEDNNPEIALVFDRYPTRGGDHFPGPWKPPLREVCLLDGSMRVIVEKQWPEFRKKQIELLVQEGLNRADAEKLYAPFQK